MAVMGIDPGKTGYMVIVDLKNGKPDVIAWEANSAIDAPSFAAALVNYNVRHLFIEKAQAMPKNGVVSMFNYGVEFGRVLGWIETTLLPHTLVSPITWTKEMHQGVEAPTPKKKSAIAFKRLFPELAEEKKFSDGFIDATLIAEYGRRHIK